MSIKKTKYGLMRRILILEFEFNEKRFEKLREEFHKTLDIPDDDNFGLMDSDESPYLFYAEAFLKGYKEAKHSPGNC